MKNENGPNFSWPFMLYMTVITLERLSDIRERWDREVFIFFYFFRIQTSNLNGPAYKLLETALHLSRLSVQ